MNKKMYPIVLFSLIMVLSACNGTPAPSPTIDQGLMETQIAEEVASQLTQIALEQPTATPLPPTAPAPTNTLLPTTEVASPTPTLPAPSNTPDIPMATQKPLPTATSTPSSFACEITAQKPINGKIFEPGDNFDAVWTVENTGTEIWDSTEVDYRYDSGDELHEQKIYDLPETIESGESIDLIVDMLAPDDEGEYDTTWVLRRGSNIICTMSIEIEVEK